MPTNPQARRPEPETFVDSEGVAVVDYVVTRCPNCGGGRCRVYKTALPFRWHECRDCGEKFKSVDLAHEEKTSG